MAYTDADWAGNQDDYTSTSAYVLYLGSTPISWSSKKQKAVARSPTEAEYRSIATAAAEISWLRSLLQELHYDVQRPPRLLCDNLGATFYCNNPVFTTRMKHIAIDFHFVRDQIANRQLTTSHLPAEKQIADCLTKVLPKAKFYELRSKMCVRGGTPILRGHIRKESDTPMPLPTS